MPVFCCLLVGGPDPQLLKSGCDRSVPRGHLPPGEW